MSTILHVYSLAYHDFDLAKIGIQPNKLPKEYLCKGEQVIRIWKHHLRAETHGIDYVITGTLQINHLQPEIY